MMKNRIAIILSATLMVSCALGIQSRVTNINLQKQNALIQEQNIETQSQIEQIQSDLQKSQEDYNKLLEEARKVEDERQRLKQELDNTKALQEKAEKELSVSRGLSHVTFSGGSRVDVKTGITARILNKAFVGTGLEGLGQAFVDAEQKYEINAIFLAAIAALESGWGSSSFAQNRNNLFGFGSYDYDTNSTVSFDSKGESVMKVAEALRRDYLNADGVYFNGATPSGINIKYCTSSNWDSQVSDIMNIIIGRATK